MFSELSEDNLDVLVQRDQYTIVQYSAGWCGNCRLMKPKFKRLGLASEDMDFIVVNAEKFPESRKLAKVDNLPTFAIFKNSVLEGQIQTNKIDVLKTFIDETTSN